MEDLLCEHCNQPVKWKMAQVTMNRYRKVLCPQGQIQEIKRTYPEKLKGLAIARVKESLHI